MKGIYHKILFENSRNDRESWSNEFKEGTHDLILLAKSAEELKEMANRFSLYGTYITRWTIEHDNPRFTRLISTDCFGNIHYVVAYKA